MNQEIGMWVSTGSSKEFIINRRLMMIKKGRKLNSQVEARELGSALTTHTVRKHSPF